MAIDTEQTFLYNNDCYISSREHVCGLGFVLIMAAANERTGTMGSRSTDSLSVRQRDILNYIEDFMARRGFPPAIRQIQETLGISSTSVVAYNLKALEGKGMLKREGKVSRGITIPQAAPARLSRQHGTQVPLLGVITAGQPLPNPEEISAEAAETIDVPADVASAERLQDVYALKVRGHSMIDALIDDGDIVLIHYQQTADNGQMVAARIEEDNSVTLKKFYREGNRVRLQPANITMDPIYIDAANVRIEGRVVGVLRQMF
jgi:repressor LexA